MTAGLCVEGLRFQRPASGFTLAVERLTAAAGRRTALIGPSGAGKTTLLHLLAGILTADAGRIRIGETEVSALDDAARRRFRIVHLGMIFQTFDLLDHLTARENMLLPYYVTPALRRTAEVEATVGRLATTLGIGHCLQARPPRLSHGERQRVAIGRALVTAPAWILADEPTGNLDPDNTRTMLELVFREVAERGVGFLMVTHDHALLEQFDSVVDLRDVLAEAGA